MAKKGKKITTEMVKDAWTKMFKERNYPLSDFQVKDKNEKGEVVKLRPLEWEAEQKLNQAQVKEFLADKKNSQFLKCKITWGNLVIHQPWRYFASPAALNEFFDNLQKYCDYIAVAYEVGNSGETERLQGYIRFKREMRLKGEELVKRLGSPNLYWRKASVNGLSNYLYVLKDENININKWVYHYGNISDDKLIRKNYDCSEFVNFVIKDNILITDETMDLYCADYRKNPSKAQNIITKLYYARKPKTVSVRFRHLNHITFCGDTGSGKSWITRYLIMKTGITFPRDVVKLETYENSTDKKVLFNNDAALKPILWIPEMSCTFPSKVNLLSLLDRESELQVKGKDTVPNLFDMAFLNATNMTPYSIYNTSQNTETSYREIARRVKKQGAVYFVFPNEEWESLKEEEQDRLLSIDYLGTLEKYPPKIFKEVSKQFPDFRDHLNWDEDTISFDGRFEFISDDKIKETVIKKTKKWGPIDQKEPFIYDVQEITLQDVEEEFKKILKKMNSPLLKTYGNIKSRTAIQLEKIQAKLNKTKKDVSSLEITNIQR